MTKDDKQTTPSDIVAEAKKRSESPIAKRVSSTASMRFDEYACFARSKRFLASATMSLGFVCFSSFVIGSQAFYGAVSAFCCCCTQF